MVSLIKTALTLAALVTIASAPFTAVAHDFKVGQIAIAHPYAIATVKGQMVGGVFFTHIENKSSSPDRLIAANVSKNVASSTEIHTMDTESDVMRMRQITAIELPAKAKVPMTRGLKKDGYHIMLMGLKKQLKVGEKLPLKLTFERAGVVNVIVNIEALKASSGAATGHGASGGNPTMQMHH
jgi:copper(I)-binding protein